MEIILFLLLVIVGVVLYVSVDIYINPKGSVDTDLMFREGNRLPRAEYKRRFRRGYYHIDNKNYKKL